MLDIIIGPVAGVLGISGLGWQLYKMVRTGETKAISYSLSTLVGGSITLWTVYGISKNDPVIYVPNAILIGILLGMSIYKMKREGFQKSAKGIRN